MKIYHTISLVSSLIFEDRSLLHEWTVKLWIPALVELIAILWVLQENAHNP